MKITAPDYYKKFKCIADRCIHCCCIGWEIDIDDKSFSAYKNHAGELKTRFETGISAEGESPHFVQQKDGRCPFLNDKNLCDIFIHMGEKCLCQVCTDHPRFRNFYSGMTEMGLGLCCEEAGRIVLSHDGDFSMVSLEDDETVSLLPEETEFFQVRSRIFDVLDDETLDLGEKFDELMQMSGIEEKNDIFENLPSFFENLEYMETDISALIEQTPVSDRTVLKKFNKEFKNLAVYFVFRNFTDALDDGMYVQRLIFAVLSAKAVESMCEKYLEETKNLTFEDVVDFARIYSTEIEYSDKNIVDILEKITEQLS